MVKKLKAIAKAKDKDDNQLARAIRDSAQQIWLAGLGAFAKAREERTKVFEALVKEGRGIQLRTKAMAEERIGEVTERVSEVREKVGKQATDSWDRLEQVFEDRVSRALGRLGVPTSKDIKALIARVDELTASLQALGGKTGARGKAAAAGAAARRPAARKAAAAKPAARKPAARKAAAAPAARAGAKKAAAPAAAARKAVARKAAAPRKAAGRQAAAPQTAAPAEGSATAAENA